jgi:hypothetical protein
MQPSICSLLGKSAARLVIVLTLLLPAGILFAPQIGRAQNIPMPGNPQIAGSWCPQCKKYFDMPNGKRPSSCPHCGYSFVQPPKPKTPPQAGPKLKPINPFGNSLFTNSSITPDDGKLQTRHFDKDGLAAKAEAWGKEMKQVDAQSRQNQEAHAREFERNKQDLLRSLDASRSNSPAHQQLKNIFAGGENGWDQPGKSTGVRIPDNATVKLLRDPEFTGEPLERKKLSDRAPGTLTDQELAVRTAENQKEIQSLMLAAKRDVDTGSRQQKAWSGVEDDLGNAKADLVKATGDAVLWGGFASEGNALEQLGHKKTAMAFDVLNKGNTLHDDGSEGYKAYKEGDGVKAGVAAGDLALDYVPEKLVGKAFAEKASGYYAVGKFGIEYTAALWSLSIHGDTVQQLDSQNAQRTSDNYLRGEKLKKLEEEQKLLKAENDRRAVPDNTQ